HVRYVWSDLRSVWLLLPGMFVQTFAMGVLMPVLVLYTHDVLGFSGALYSALLVTSGGATVCLQLPVGRWVDRVGYRPFLVGGFAVCAVLLPTFLQLRDAAYVFLGAAGLGLGYAMILPAWSAVLAQAVSEARKAVMWGIFMTVEGLGMAAGPLVSSRLWTSLGSSAPFWATSGILFAMMLFYGFAPLERWSARTAEDSALEELREVL
ncbi:MAG: MFS transporter, partial [Alicyclobacillus sp.]|nr:MFS transporter [Alicyclobacillus sp.]